MHAGNTCLRPIYVTAYAFTFTDRKTPQHSQICYSSFGQHIVCDLNGLAARGMATSHALGHRSPNFQHRSTLIARFIFISYTGAVSAIFTRTNPSTAKISVPRKRESRCRYSVPRQWKPLITRPRVNQSTARPVYSSWRRRNNPENQCEVVRSRSPRLRGLASSTVFSSHFCAAAATAPSRESVREGQRSQ